MMTSSLVKPVMPSQPDVFTLHYLLETYPFHQKFKSECVYILYTSIIDVLFVSSQDYHALFSFLPEEDKPSYFGLPANIDHSRQRTVSTQVSIVLT